MKLRWSKPSKGPKKAGKPNNAIAHYATSQFSLTSLVQLENDLKCLKDKINLHSYAKSLNFVKGPTVLNEKKRYVCQVASQK